MNKDSDVLGFIMQLQTGTNKARKSKLMKVEDSDDASIQSFTCTIRWKVTAKQYKVILSHHFNSMMKYFYPDGSGLF